MNKRYCLTLNLKDDPELIQQYDQYHKAVWPEIISSIKASGIEELEIYRLQTRLFMIMGVNDDFTFDRKAAMDGKNSKVQEWENLMWKYQEAMPAAAPGEKWMLMKQIFNLKAF